MVLLNSKVYVAALVMIYVILQKMLQTRLKFLAPNIFPKIECDCIAKIKCMSKNYPFNKKTVTAKVYPF